MPNAAAVNLLLGAIAQQTNLTTTEPGADTIPLELPGGLIFAATNVALGACILLALIFEPRGLVHRWMVTKNTLQIWPFPPR